MSSAANDCEVTKTRLLLPSLYLLMKTKGFSLMEVLVAMLVLTLIAAGMLGIFVSGKGFVICAGHKTEAINRAREKMEEFKSMAYPDIPVGGGTEPLSFSGGISATRTWEVTSIAGDEFKYIGVSVSWIEGGSTKQERIVTLIANPG